MSLRLLSQEIAHFLGTSEPEVLCITGRWGVGKTYAWNAMLADVRARKAVCLKRYAYVSLFGLSSLDDVKAAIFENTVPSELAGTVPGVDNLNAALETVRGAWRKTSRILKDIPQVSGYAALARQTLFMSVREQIICIDDLERSGNGLSLREVLGLLSFLKDQRRCKVVFLLNEDALSGDGAADFRAQLEKVADSTVKLDPTPREAADIGLEDQTAISKVINQQCVALGIVNIRTIKKIVVHNRRVSEAIRGLDPRIHVQAARTVTLAAFAKYQPDSGLTLASLRDYNEMAALLDDAQPHEESTAHAMMRAAGWSHADDFDRAILDGIARGVLDTEHLRRMGEQGEHELRLQDQQEAFRAAWRPFHDSFDDNEQEVVDALVAGVRDNLKVVSPRSLDQVVRFLKDLGQDQEARVVLEIYADREEPAGFWDLHQHSFAGSITDPDVIALFERKSARPDSGRNPMRDILMIEPDGWTDDVLERAATISTDEFYDLFRRLRGKELADFAAGALRLRKIINSDERMQAIVSNAESALRKLGEESNINRQRLILKHGIRPPFND